MGYDGLSLIVWNKTNFVSINFMNLMKIVAIFQTFVTGYKKFLVVRWKIAFYPDWIRVLRDSIRINFREEI